VIMKSTWSDFFVFFGNRVHHNIQKTKTAVSEFDWVRVNKKNKAQILAVQLGWIK
jgi:hypothetical protein